MLLYNFIEEVWYFLNQISPYLLLGFFIAGILSIFISSDFIEKNLGKKAIVNFLPMQPGDVKESFADINKSEEMLGYQPSINVDLGIRNFIRWYKKCSI